MGIGGRTATGRDARGDSGCGPGFKRFPASSRGIDQPVLDRTGARDVGRDTFRQSSRFTLGHRHANMECLTRCARHRSGHNDPAAGEAGAGNGGDGINGVRYNSCEDRRNEDYTDQDQDQSRWNDSVAGVVGG